VARLLKLSDWSIEEWRRESGGDGKRLEMQEKLFAGRNPGKRRSSQGCERKGGKPLPLLLREIFKKKKAGSFVVLTLP